MPIAAAPTHLLALMREAIAAGRFDELRREWVSGKDGSRDR